MLLLAPELLAIALCFGSAGIELDPIDTINEVNLGKLVGDMRASAAA